MPSERFERGLEIRREAPEEERIARRVLAAERSEP